MLIISLNINDFGGVNNYLAKLKSKNGRQDWESWAKIDKSKPVEKLMHFVEDKQPNVLVLQEYEVNNSRESMDFIEWMKKRGYKICGNIPDYKASMTILFAQSNNCIEDICVSHNNTRLNFRDYAIRIEDYIIYGTHVPLNSKQRPTIREDYWDEIIDFYEENKNQKIILIGDFNTYDKSSEAYKRYKKLLELGACDLWIGLENSDNTPTQILYRNRLDYIFISPSVEKHVMSMDIDTKLMDNGEMSDHAPLILKLN